MTKTIDIDGKRYEVIGSVIKLANDDIAQINMVVPGIKESGELKILREVKNEMPEILPGDALSFEYEGSKYEGCFLRFVSHVMDDLVYYWVNEECYSFHQSHIRRIYRRGREIWSRQ